MCVCFFVNCLNKFYPFLKEAAIKKMQQVESPQNMPVEGALDPKPAEPV